VTLLLAVNVAACGGRESRVVSPPPLQPRVPTASPTAVSPSAAQPAQPTAPPTATAQAPETPTPPITPGLTAPPAPTPAPGARPATPPARGRQIVLNFDNADIEAVIQAASEIVGFNYTIGPGVAGKKVTVQTSGRIPEDEVLNVLLAVLEVNGVTAVRSGNLYKIVPLATARERPLPTIIGAQADPGRRDDEVITQIVPVIYVPAERIAGAIRPFVQGGNVVVYGNLLLVTDTAGNVGRLLQIVRALDVEVTTDELRIVPVRFADATEIGKILSDFFAGRRARTPTTVAPVAPPAPRPGVPAVPGVPTTSGDAERPPLIIADKRTNTLILSARRGDLDTILQLLGQLDVDTQANKRVFVYYVENVKAKDLAGTLAEIFGKPGQAGSSRLERREVPPGAPPIPGGPPGFPGAPGAPPPTGPPPGPAGQSVEGEPGVVEGEVKVVADEPNNALIITTFPRNWPLIEDTVRKLDRTPKQVLIEVLVAEVNLTDQLALGLEWTLRNQQNIQLGGQTYNIGSVGRLDVGPPAPTLPAPTLPGLPVTVPPVSGLAFFIFETDRFMALLNLFASYGMVNVLSSPHILTSENKKASINVSQSVPIVTQFTGAQGGTVISQSQQPPQTIQSSNVEYRDAGIILTVTPRISDKRVVALDVKQTVNDVGAPQPPSGSPIIIKRELETSIVLNDNQTLVMGGLIQTRNENTQQGIPGLSRIPYIGFLFGRQNESFRRTELLLLLTPRVIGDPAEARELYDRVRAQRPELVRNLRTHPSILQPELLEPVAAPALPSAPPPSVLPPPGPAPGGSPSER
jgi:general secretion pathway protein D